MDSVSFANRLEVAYQTALAALLAERTPEGHWVGELSTSALSTATAITALALVQSNGSPARDEDTGSSSLIPSHGQRFGLDRPTPQAPTEQRRGTRTSNASLQAGESGRFDTLIAGGLDWLIEHQNEDGGWGDTTKSLSNISTSMLVRATFALLSPLPPCGERGENALRRLEAYLDRTCGKSVSERAEAIRRRYGKDRTFAVPILTMCALAGLVPWTEVPPLPFELACFPQSWFRLFRLPVVSYALPALIAIGQAVHQHRPSWNPLTSLIRRFARAKSLRVLQSIQPSSGGFLEATPLTSFVTMSLASIGQADHAVARKGIEFIVNSVRADGSWPIDTNLATWVTTLSINALATAGEVEKLDRKDAVRDWLLKQQFMERHPYTGADPGGWGWTDLPGSVPDCDDTPGALLAVRALLTDSSPTVVERVIRESRTPGALANRWRHRLMRLRLVPFELGFAEQVYVENPWGKPGVHVLVGLNWLYFLENRDGGWPTFCRGWGNLPFDRSGTDLTAHALRAISAWRVRNSAAPVLVVVVGSGNVRVVVDNGSILGATPDPAGIFVRRGLAYLARTQRPDGSWLPLWFGNQHAPDDENPTYGTARVLAAYRDLDLMDSEPARRGVAWLLAAQNADGGWGGAKGVPSSIEETALAVEVLLDVPDVATPLKASRERERPEDPATDDVPSAAVNRGLAWLIQQVEAGGLHHPTPIGFYFAKLWYYEKLYPIIFAVAALGRARRKKSC